MRHDKSETLAQLLAKLIRQRAEMLEAENPDESPARIEEVRAILLDVASNLDGANVRTMH